MDAELWHVLNRGVEKRDIVLDDNDRARFIHNLYVMNDANIVVHASQADRRSGELRHKREILVHIHAYCLMNNHYHILLSEEREGGIPAFMQKFNMGFSKYFNEKYDRTGVLWQGKHKKILVKKDAHYLYIPFYIHLNPLDYDMPEWRDGVIKNTNRSLKILREYRWSSHLDYLGIKNFPSIIRKDIIGDILGTRRAYEKEIVRTISDPKRIGDTSIIES
jgi:putative transposase